MGPKSSTVGSRLAEERQRLEQSQTLFATQTGVSKHTQINYEKGDSSPSAHYLAKAAAFGVDVLYVVTGERTPVRQRIITAVENDQTNVDWRPVLVLDERAQKLIENYERADETGKTFIDMTAAHAAQVKASKKRPKG